MLGAAALVLATVGLYAVTAYAVTQQRREIGIRMALGADRSRVLRRVVGQAMRLAAMGIALGLLLSLPARPALESFLYGAAAIEPWAFAGVPLLFLFVAAAASFLPARRAAAIDPAIVLRQE